ncbi:MAG: GatB/YqeY domain-containing protein [Alphaproteobacteria bacterium]|nr:GatB/YqeY domain-containing protein [Alphaproteobacteria bacterium]
MPLRTQITDAMKNALRAKDERTLATTRMIIAKMRDLDIAARPKGNAEGIGDDEIMAMLQGMIKQRRESIALYEKGNRADLVQQESEEIAVIERFLPQQMDEAAISAAIDKIIAATAASSIKDMGKVMGELKKAYTGQMDFAKAGALVKGRLAG